MATKKTKKQEKAHWEMIRDISREVCFNTGIPDEGYHGLEISRFPSQIQLAEFGSAPYRERTMPHGLVGVTNGLDAQLMIVEKNIVKADARLSLYYSDDCGPAYQVEGYFSNGGIVCVQAGKELTEPYIASLRQHLTHDSQARLKTIFGELLAKSLPETERAFQKVQGLVRNSDLPYHYKEAVNGIL